MITCVLQTFGSEHRTCILEGDYIEEGYEADAEAARTILDEQAVRLESKYSGPIPSSLTVKLYAEPAPKVRSAAATLFSTTCFIGSQASGPLLLVQDAKFGFPVGSGGSRPTASRPNCVKRSGLFARLSSSRRSTPSR